MSLVLVLVLGLVLVLVLGPAIGYSLFPSLIICLCLLVDLSIEDSSYVSDYELAADDCLVESSELSA